MAGPTHASSSLSSSWSLSQVETRPPVPLTERSRPVKFQVQGDGGIVYAQGRSLFTRRDERVEELRQSSPLSIARLAPSGRRIALGDIHGTLRIFNFPVASVSTPRFEGRVLAGRIVDLRWSVDEDFVVAVGEGRGLFAAVINAETGQTLGELAGPTKACNAVAVSPQAPHAIAVGSDDFTVGIYQERPFRLCKTLKDHTGFVTAVEYSPMGDVLATAGSDGKILLYDGTTGTLLHTLSAPNRPRSTITGLVWLSDELLCSSSTEGSIRLWNVSSRQLVKSTDDVGSQVLGLQASARGEHMTAIVLGGSLLRFDSNLNVLTRYGGHSKAILCCLIVDGQPLYSADVDGCVVSWKDGRGTVVFQECDGSGIHSIYRGADGPMVSSHTGRRIVALGDESSSWSLPEGVLFTQLLAPDCLLVLARTNVSLYRSASPLTQLTLSEAATAACIGAGEDRTLFVADTSKAIRRIRVDGGELRLEEGTLTGNVGEIGCMAVSSDGRYLACGDNQRRIQLYDLPSNTMISTKMCFHASTVTCLAWSMDSRFLVSGGLDDSIMLWSPSECRSKPLAQVSRAHAGAVNKVYFLDNRRFVTCGADGCLRIWSITEQ